MEYMETKIMKLRILTFFLFQNLYNNTEYNQSYGIVIIVSRIYVRNCFPILKTHLLNIILLHFRLLIKLNKLETSFFRISALFFEKYASHKYATKSNK